MGVSSRMLTGVSLAALVQPGEKSLIEAEAETGGVPGGVVGRNIGAGQRPADNSIGLGTSGSSSAMGVVVDRYSFLYFSARSTGPVWLASSSAFNALIN